MAQIQRIKTGDTNWGDEATKLNTNFNQLNQNKVEAVPGSRLITEEEAQKLNDLQNLEQPNLNETNQDSFAYVKGQEKIQLIMKAQELQNPPTSSTLTYQVNGETFSYKIGQFVRAIVDGEPKIYQLYNIVNGSAVWKETNTGSGGGGEVSGYAEGFSWYELTNPGDIKPVNGITLSKSLVTYTIAESANGRLIHGWTKEQADQEIEKGVLSQSDVIFLDSTNQIYAFKKFWGSSGGTSEGGENKFLDVTAIFDLMGQQGGNLSDENVAAIRKAFQDHVSTGFISIDTVVGTGYVPMEIIKLPESAVSGHEIYRIVISTLSVEGSSQAQHEMSGYADNIIAIVCDVTSKLYEVTIGAMAFKIDGNGNKYLADDGVYHEINVDTTEITNKLNTLTSDVNTLKTDVANLKSEVNGASAALTELEEASK